MSEWKKICCAVDASDPSRLALDEALGLAARLRAALTLVYVHPSLPPMASVFAPSRDKARDESRGDEVLEAWRADAERRLGAPVRARVLHGEPAAEIERLAREERFDLIVVGSHDGASLGRLVLGAVADRVAREAPCPVLVARHRERSEADEIAAEVALYH